MLALDLSASVKGPRLVVLRRAGYTLIDALTSSDSAALVTFNRAAVLTGAADDGPRSISAPHSPRPTADGYTALIDATQAALLMGATDGSRTSS